jgi:gliding motility-associated-like protein
MRDVQKILAVLLAGGGLASLSAQAITNHGASMQLHGEVQVGIHAHFTNNGEFSSDRSLVGFYSDGDPLRIGGTNEIELYDAEFAAAGGLILENNLVINNNGNLIEGDVRTTKDETIPYSIRFNDDTFYTGESAFSKVDGYAAFRNKEEFTFPVGDGERLRPLTIESMAINPSAVSSYFSENSGEAQRLAALYSPNNKANEDLRVSSREFWFLAADLPSKVTLTWDAQSDVRNLSPTIEGLRVVGWNKAARQWQNLGNTRFEGDVTGGAVRSDVFNPSEFGMITLGGLPASSSEYRVLELDNYYLSPNGDGNNERLVIEAVAEAPNNFLQIFNQSGALVYEKNNYQNEFDGNSNTMGSFNRGQGLPQGVYFYIITFPELRLKHQGYFYLNR